MTTPTKSPETLRVIELLLLWEGAAGNERARDLLDLHFTTVSRLLTQYAELNGVGLSYSNAQRSWVADADFRPRLTTGTIEEYLAATLPERTQASSIVVRTQFDFGGANHRAFAVLHRAIREGAGVTGTHASLRNPTPAAKTFYPHTLVEAGRRWHMRAYVAEAGKFQDIALTRLRNLYLTDLARPEEAQQSKDVAWTTFVPLRVIPHPALSADQKQVVRAEYFNGSAARTETVRAALLPYVIQDLKASLNPTTQQPPDFQLSVDGVEKIAMWLMPSA